MYVYISTKVYFHLLKLYVNENNKSRINFIIVLLYSFVINKAKERLLIKLSLVNVEQISQKQTYILPFPVYLFPWKITRNKIIFTLSITD